MRKGMSLMLQAAFVILLLSVSVTLVVTRFTTPTLAKHGLKQAEIAAERIADAVNALSSIEKGYIEHNLTAPWDLRIYIKEGVKYINVSHELYSAEARILGNVYSDTLSDVEVVGLTKEPGEYVKMEKV